MKTMKTKLKSYCIVFKMEETGNRQPPRMVKAETKEKAIENFEKDNPNLIFISAY